MVKQLIARYPVAMTLTTLITVIVALVGGTITVAGLYYNVDARQDQFEVGQGYVVSSIAELKTDTDLNTIGIAKGDEQYEWIVKSLERIESKVDAL